MVTIETQWGVWDKCVENMASASGSSGASGHVESGILRKRSKFSPENQEELLVFGYQCHLFRDDEKAQFIDQGKHLIPWMNDNSIKIDRLIMFLSHTFATSSNKLRNKIIFFNH